MKYCFKHYLLLSFLLILLTVQATAEPSLITLTWNDNPETTQAITWRENASTLHGCVEYTETAAYPEKSAQVNVPYSRLSTNTGIYNIFSGKLTGLKPGTTYNYRLGDGKNWSNIGSFTTAPNKTEHFTFLVFGDSQSTSYSKWGDTIHAAYKAFPNAAFFTNVGDLVDKGDDYKQWFSWLANAQGVINYISCMPASGNHENYSISGNFMLPTGLKALLPLPQNGPALLKGVTYSFDYSNAHFVVLDTQYAEEGKLLPNLISIQKDWLEQDLAATNKSWKFIIMHRPIYNNTISESHSNLRAAFAPIFDKYAVDVVFNGHDHAYARTYPLSGGKKTTAGTVYINCGRSGTKFHRTGLSEMYWDSVYYNPTDLPCYISCTINNNSFRLTACKQDGTLIDNWTLTKGS